MIEKEQKKPVHHWATQEHLWTKREQKLLLGIIDKEQKIIALQSSLINELLRSHWRFFTCCFCVCVRQFIKTQKVHWIF